jgi:hypothetical protein
MTWKRSFLTTSSCCMWQNALSMMKQSLCGRGCHWRNKTSNLFQALLRSTVSL